VAESEIVDYALPKRRRDQFVKEEAVDMFPGGDPWSKTTLEYIYLQEVMKPVVAEGRFENTPRSTVKWVPEGNSRHRPVPFLRCIVNRPDGLDPNRLAKDVATNVDFSREFKSMSRETQVSCQRPQRIKIERQPRKLDLQRNAIQFPIHRNAPPSRNQDHAI
jgi:hypothetical protein